MAVTVAELTKQGELKITGEINERLPAVTDGLIAYFPFDGTDKGIRFNNILDYSTWVIGSTGSQTGFICNGLSTENYIIEGLDPFGKKAPIWEARPDSTSGPDGGWKTGKFSVDNTKLYRFSVWVKRKVIGNDGRFYFGCYGYNSSGVNTGVIRLSDGTTQTNPYFWYSNRPPTGQLPEDEWVLVVGHVYPYDYTGTSNHADSGIYNTKGEKIGDIHFDYKWLSDTVKAAHRTYLYYCTDTNVRQQWCYPRVDLCDGSEPTIEDLIRGVNGEGNVINPITNTNTTLTYEGIAIEESTENLLETVGNASQEWTNWSHWNSTYWGSCEQYDDPVWGKVFKGIKDGAGSTYTYIYDYYPYSYSVGDVLSFSCWMRVNKDMTKTISFYVNSSSGGRHYVATSDSKTITFKRGEWQYISWTSGSVTEDVVGTGGFGLSMGTGWEGCIVEVAYPQLEKKNYSTSFVKGSRSGSGYIDIGNLNLNTFTLVFDFKPRAEYYKIMTAAYNREMLCMYDDNLGVRIEYDDYISTPSPSQTYSAPFFNLEPNASWISSGTAHYHHNVAYEKNKIHKWIMVKSGNQLRVIVACENTILRDEVEIVNTDLISLNDFTMTRLRLGKDGSDIWSGVVKRLAIYNKALSDEEIKQLYSSSFNLQPNGDLITPKIEIKPSLPDDVYYFPLGVDTKDEYKYLDAVSNANLVFEDGSVWVGNSSTNLFDNLPREDSLGLFSSMSRGTAELHCGIITPYAIKHVATGDNSFCNAIDASGNGYNTAIGKPTISGGSDVTISVWVRGENGGEEIELFIFEYDTIDGTWDRASSKRLYITNEWQKYTFTRTTNSTAVRVWGRFDNNINGNIVYWDAPMLEIKSFASPFVNGTRSQSDLEFNLYDSIGLDWNSDWSIVYWKKPVGTHDNTLNGYNIESLGCNSNSVGGGYRWWGKRTGYNTLYVSSTGEDIYTFNPNNYFNNWHMVSIVKSSTNVTWKFWGIDGQIISTTQTWGTIASNCFVTQYGYDLKLGGWDDTRICNTYFKDLIVAKRALTDEELDKLYRCHLEIFKDKIIVKSISTGQVI